MEAELEIIRDSCILVERSIEADLQQEKLYNHILKQNEAMQMEQEQICEMSAQDFENYMENQARERAIAKARELHIPLYKFKTGAKLGDWITETYLVLKKKVSVYR